MRWAWSSISEVTKSFVRSPALESCIEYAHSISARIHHQSKRKGKGKYRILEKKNGSPYLRRSGWCKGKQSRKPNLMAELIGFRLQKDHRANFLIGIKYLTAICLYVCPTRDFLLPLAVASLVFHEILLPPKSLFSGEIKIFGIHFLGSLSPNNYLSNANILTFLILPFVFF